jgi:hypothetical protein
MIDRAALVRQALSSLQRIQGVARPNPSVQAPASRVDLPVGPQGSAGVRGAQFERRVRQRITEIAADDPQRRRRALRILVEMALLNEFGARLEADPAFHSMIEQVVTTMDDDESLRAGLDLVLKDLTPTR